MGGGKSWRSERSSSAVLLAQRLCQASGGSTQSTSDPDSGYRCGVPERRSWCCDSLHGVLEDLRSVLPNCWDRSLRSFPAKRRELPTGGPDPETPAPGLTISEHLDRAIAFRIASDRVPGPYSAGRSTRRFGVFFNPYVPGGCRTTGRRRPEFSDPTRDAMLLAADPPPRASRVPARTGDQAVPPLESGYPVRGRTPTGGTLPRSPNPRGPPRRIPRPGHRPAR